MQRDNILVKKPNINICYADDPHLHFTFGEYASYQYNLFITNTNKGGGTKRVASPDSTVSFATPDYQNNTYLLGVTKKQKTFKHTVAADRLLPEEVDQILQWLKVGEVGFLSYDTNPLWGWDAVITSVGEVSEYENSDGMIIEFTVEFKTLNDWHARSIENATKRIGTGAMQNFYDELQISKTYSIPSSGKVTDTIDLETTCIEIVGQYPTETNGLSCNLSSDGKQLTLDYTRPTDFTANTIEIIVDLECQAATTSHTIANEFGIPEIIVDDSTIYLPQVCDEHSFVNIDWLIPTSGTTKRCKVASGNNTLYDYTFYCGGTTLVNYLGQYGFSLTGNHLVEDVSGLVKDSNASELLILNNELPKQVSNPVLSDIGDFVCKLYSVEEGSSWNGLPLSTDTTVGNVYGVEITIVKGYKADQTLDSKTWILGNTTPGNLIATYFGKANILTITGSGTLSTIKHRSL